MRWHSANSVRSTIAAKEGTDSHSQTADGNRMIPAHKEETMTNYDYLIIGGGMSAPAGVDGIREVDPTGGIGMISTEPDPTTVLLSRKCFGRAS